MSLFTRRRFLAAAPATGLATGASLALGGGTAAAAAVGSVEFVTPFRLQDSRTMEPDKYDTSAQDTLLVQGLAGKLGVILNVTVTETEGAGFFRIADGFEPVPSTSSINWFADGQTVANMAIVPAIQPTGGISIQGGGAGRAHLIIDVVALVS